MKALRGNRVNVIDTEPEEALEGRGEPTEETKVIQLDDNPEHTTWVGTLLSQELRN